MLLPPAVYSSRSESSRRKDILFKILISQHKNENPAAVLSSTSSVEELALNIGTLGEVYDKCNSWNKLHLCVQRLCVIPVRDCHDGDGLRRAACFASLWFG